MPKLCLMRVSVVAPFSWPTTQMLSPRKRPKPPIRASSSANLRSPAIGVNSVIRPPMKSVKCGRCGCRATSVFCHGVRLA
ncbi:hypothetical protein ACVWW1_006051 [Bradyrhizobium sp. JR3.5]